MPMRATAQHRRAAGPPGIVVVVARAEGAASLCQS